MNKFVMALFIAGLNVSVLAEEVAAPVAEPETMSAEQLCKDAAVANGVADDEMETYMSDCMDEYQSEEMPAVEEQSPN